MSSARGRIVVLGMMAKMPVPGVAWQTVHYMLGLRRLGLDPYYVEAHGRTPSMLMEAPTDDSSTRAAEFISKTLTRFDFGDRWCYQALHDDGRCFGMSEPQLNELYREAELLINLHGGTRPRPELYETKRLVYLETDPVRLQIELHDGVEESFEFLEPHIDFFTFAENLGRSGCGLPTCERFPFRPTRQPVVLDLWQGRASGAREAYTTIGNWQQGWRTVHFRGEDYGWSKDTEWMKFMQLPCRTGKRFELALSGYQPRHREYLEKYAWHVRDALAFGSDVDAYRDYIVGSRAEFTVAKDQNIRFQTGWFSDRSATYLAAGRPVITQDTGFGCALPTGEGLFAVSCIEEAEEAVEAIEADYERHANAASEIAREYFDAERVLGALVKEVGMSIGRRVMSTYAASPDGPPTTADAASRVAGKGDGRRAPRAKLGRHSSVLALIPHFRCEEWLDDCLQSLTEQTRPLEGIVVIDDASETPPTRLVQRYPQVTLLHAERNVGPYRLIQQVIEDTDYDAYLFQDADDWSAPDRLERLLDGAERTGAELIGTQEMRVFCDEPEAVPIHWPLDVDAVFKERATAFPLLHPTSLVSRDLVMAAPFSTGLRFGGDAEFLRRARFIAHVANVPGYSYCRRIRQGSLTTARATRIGSPVRKEIMQLTFARANSNAERVAAGKEPDLSPIRTAPPVGFDHLAGPPLRRAGAARERQRPAPPRSDARCGEPKLPAPIFVVGADRSGATALACALGQHPRISLTSEGGFMGDLAERLAEVREAALADDPNALGPEPPTSEDFCAAFGAVAAGLIDSTGGAGRWVDGSRAHTANVARLAELFPQSKFIHIVRDADSAVRAAVDPPLGSAGATGGTQIPEWLRSRIGEREALEGWLGAVEGCLEAERSLGSPRMLRVAYGELVAAPEALVRRCLEFAGESYGPECLRPLRGLRGEVEEERAEAASASADEANGELWERARALSETLLGTRAVESTPGLSPTPDIAPPPGAAAAPEPAPSAESERARLRALSRRTTREVLSRLVPEGATVLVVSRGDDELLEHEGRRCLHFPQLEDGVWTGSHPTDSAEAIEHLQELRAGGARFIFFPCTSLWWLEHYDRLARHLEEVHSVVLRDSGEGALFELRPPAAEGEVPAPAAIANRNGRAKAPARPPRVVMVTDHFPKFSETFFVSKFLGLRRRGWDVHVVSNRSNREHWEFFPELREEIGDRLHVTKDVEAELRQLRPDLIHFGYGTLARGRMDLGESLGSKLVVSFRGYDINSFGVEDKRCYEDVWQSADMIHVVGENIWERVRRRGCPSDRPHTVITDAVDSSLLQPPERELVPVGTADRPFRVLSVGRIHWKKGHEYGLAAMRLLLDRGIQVRYRIIGEGDHREPTLFSIEDLGLADHVEMVGGKNAYEVRKDLRWADAFLHPSLTEAFGVAVIEAQAMSLPVVCSDAGGLPENVADGVSGFVVPRRDPDGLADRLARLAGDPELREKMGHAARRRVEERFDVEHQLDRFEQLYRDLLGTPTGRASVPPTPPSAAEESPQAARAEDKQGRATLEALRKELSTLEVRSQHLRRQVWGREVVRRVQEFAASRLPRYSNVLVVSRGDERLVELPSRHGAHFPQTEAGAWAGHHPEDSADAIEHLVELHRRGAEYLVIPGTSQWWLDYYDDFRGHLERNYRRMARTADYVVFSLDERPQEQSPAPAPGAPATAETP